MLNRAQGQSREMKSSLQNYLDEIGRTPLLSADVEVVLAEKVAEGDSVAKEKFIRANLRLVVSIAKRYNGTSRRLDLLELIQVGNIALILAVENFRLEHGFRFATYATVCIIGAIKRALFYDRRVITGRSLNSSFYEDGSSLHEGICDSKVPSPSLEAHRKYLQDVFVTVLSGLDEQERYIITLAFGLEDGVIHNDREIAVKLRKKTEWVRQKRFRALRQLKRDSRLEKME